MDNLTTLIEIYILRKESEAFFQLQKQAAKEKNKGKFRQKFRGDNIYKFDAAVCIN